MIATATKTRVEMPVAEPVQSMAVAVPEAAALPSVRATDPIAGLLQTAVTNGLPVEQMQQLMDLYERMDKRQAEKDYNDAIAAFQSECPPITKNKTGNVATDGGTKFAYTYAQLPQIAKCIAPYLHKHGLSYSWSSEQTASTLTVKCTVRHRSGHSENASATLPVATRAGMSDQQKVGSALAFGERLSLIQALGITTADADMDGQEDKRDLTPISEEQADDLAQLIAEVKADQSKFLAHLKVKRIADIPVSDYARAVKLLERKRETKP